MLSVDGLLHREAKHFLKRIAAKWLTSPIPTRVDMFGQTGSHYHKGYQLVPKGFMSEVDELT